MKAIIMSRVSTLDQKEAGNSLIAQDKRLQDYCRRKNFEIIGIYSFDETAYKTKRDEFDKVLEYLNEHKEKIALCFDKVDRFSRNVFDKRVPMIYNLAMEDKIELHFASDNLVINSGISASEKFQFGVNLGLAKYYSDSISDCVKRSYEGKILKGEWIGKAAIGYLNVTDEKGHKDIVPDSTKSHFAVRTFELYSSANYSIVTLAQEMKEMGFMSNGKPLSPSNIYNLLKNPFYYGEMLIKGKLYPHRYEPLITKELYDKCQQVMQGYRKKPFQYAAKPFSLRGMIKCAACGCTVTPESHKNHNYYSCTNFRKMHDKRIYIKEETIMEPILDC